MMMRLLLLALPLMSIFTAHAETVSVFGQDNRKVISAAEMVYPFNNIVYLSSGCTGAFVGKRLVLTAAHCLSSTADGSIISPDILYKHDGKQTLKKFTVDRSWIGHYVKSGKPEDDWAIILTKESSSHFLDYKVITGPVEGVGLAGFSGDLNQRLGLHENCSIRSVSSVKFLHDCDSTRGASGSPIFKCFGGPRTDCKVIGIHTGSKTQNSEETSVRKSYNEDYANLAVPVKTFYTFLNTLKYRYD